MTTLHDYGEDVTLRNAFVYSDNIYFAKAALQIGGETFTEYLKKIGFGQEVPFPISLTVSQYSNDGEVISAAGRQWVWTGTDSGESSSSGKHLYFFLE